MNCRQCLAIEGVFGQGVATKELARYRKKGPTKTTRLLIDAPRGAVPVTARAQVNLGWAQHKDSFRLALTTAVTCVR